MNLDLRVPLGLLFAILGALMSIFGYFTRGSAIYQRSAGVDINLIWGLVMLVFGAAMLLLGRRANRLPPSKAALGNCAAVQSLTEATPHSSA